MTSLEVPVQGWLDASTIASAILVWIGDIKGRMTDEEQGKLAPVVHALGCVVIDGIPDDQPHQAPVPPAPLPAPVRPRSGPAPDEEFKQGGYDPRLALNGPYKHFYAALQAALGGRRTHVKASKDRIPLAWVRRLGRGLATAGHKTPDRMAAVVSGWAAVYSGDKVRFMPKAGDAVCDGILAWVAAGNAPILKLTPLSLTVPKDWDDPVWWVWDAAKAAGKLDGHALASLYARPAVRAQCNEASERFATHWPGGAEEWEKDADAGMLWAARLQEAGVSAGQAV